MSIYQETPPEPSVAPIRRSNALIALIILAVFVVGSYEVSRWNNTREVTDTFESFSIRHAGYWSSRDVSTLPSCTSSLIGGCIADYVSSGRATNVEIAILSAFSFTGGNSLDNAAVRGGIENMLRGMNAEIVSREDFTWSGLPAQRIELSTSDTYGLLYVAKPSLYLHLFFAVAENATAFEGARSDVVTFMEGVTFAGVESD